MSSSPLLKTDCEANRHPSLRTSTSPFGYKVYPLQSGRVRISDIYCRNQCHLFLESVPLIPTISGTDSIPM